MNIEHLINKEELTDFFKKHLITKPSENSKSESHHEDIYNEFSLQLELGLWLKEKLGKECHIEFERNVTYFGLQKDYVKKEIDIVIYKGTPNSPNYEGIAAIELKYPAHKEFYRQNNKKSLGGYPKEMLDFVEDIKFMEELKEAKKFKHTFCITLVDDKSFYSYPSHSSKKDNFDNHIFRFFRKPQEKLPANKAIIIDGNKENKKSYTLLHSYSIEWNYLGIDPNNNDINYKFYLLEIK